jgi:hypothetical protein
LGQKESKLIQLRIIPSLFARNFFRIPLKSQDKLRRKRGEINQIESDIAGGAITEAVDVEPSAGQRSVGRCCRDLWIGKCSPSTTKKTNRIFSGEIKIFCSKIPSE